MQIALRNISTWMKNPEPDHICPLWASSGIMKWRRLVVVMHRRRCRHSPWRCHADIWPHTTPEVEYQLLIFEMSTEYFMTFMTPTLPFPLITTFTFAATEANIMKQAVILISTIFYPLNWCLLIIFHNCWIINLQIYVMCIYVCNPN